MQKQIASVAIAALIFSILQFVRRLVGGDHDKGLSGNHKYDEAKPDSKGAKAVMGSVAKVTAIDAVLVLIAVAGASFIVEKFLASILEGYDDFSVSL